MRLRNCVAGLLPPASVPNVGATGAEGVAAAGAVAGVVAEADALAGADAFAAELAAAVAAAGAGAEAFGEFAVPFLPVDGVLFA